MPDARRLRVAGMDWTVAVTGTGPVVLLLHGTGASGHSWDPVAAALARRATVVVPDLPGHGASAPWPEDPPTIPAVARALGALVAALGLAPPAVVAGHSAGAALAVRLGLDATATPPAIVGFNPSLVAPPAAYDRLVAPWLVPLVGSAPALKLAARVAREPAVVARLLASTQSALPAAGRDAYVKLMADPAHVAGALALMRGWDVAALLAACQPYAGPATFVLGARDSWIPARPLADVLARHFPAARVLTWTGGHVLPEERPHEARALLQQVLASVTG